MNSLQAFYMGEAARKAGAGQMVFDWVKAARLIKEHKPKHASAGLQSDWEYTGGTIWVNDKPVSSEDSYTYLSSCWATPELDLDGKVIDCFVMEDDSPEWGPHTFWPEEALAIINGEKE